MRLQSLAASGVRWTGLSSVFSVLSDTTKTVTLARFLSPVDYGLMAMVGVVIGFAQMYMDLGISAAIIHRQDSTKEHLSSLYWLNIFFGLLVFAVLWFSAPIGSLIFREPRVLPLLKAMAFVFLIIPIGSQFETLLEKELCFKELARWEMAAAACGTAVAITCAIAGCGAWTLVYSFLTNVSVKTLLLVRCGLKRFRPTLHFSREDVKGYIGFGLFQMGERSMNYFAEKLDQLLIGPLLGAQALGYYNFALYLTAQPVSRINPILTRVAFPVFSKVQNDPDRLKRGYIRLLGLLVTINAPLLVGLAAAAPWAVPVVFGAKWSASVILVQILSFVSLSRSIGNPIGSLQLAKGRADLGFWWNALLFALSVPVIYVGAKIGQTTGVAVSLLVLQASLNVPAYFLLVRPLIGGCARDYLRVTLRPVALAMVMGLFVAALPVLYLQSSMRVALVSQILCGALVYLTLVCMLNRSAIADFRYAFSSR